MSHLTIGQRLVLLAAAVIITAGILKSPPVKGVSEMPDIMRQNGQASMTGDGTFSSGIMAVGIDSQAWADEFKERLAELERKADLWDRHKGVFETLPEIEADAALWRKHQWRAQVDAVMEKVCERWRADKRWGRVWTAREVARALVKGAREARIPLGRVVALADHESRLWPVAVGKQGEIGLMQVYPVVGRPWGRLRTDVFFNVEWALQNCFAPIYHKHGFREALLHYNNRSGEYADEVMALEAHMVKEDGLWAIIPE